MNQTNQARLNLCLILALVGLISAAAVVLNPARLASAQAVAASWRYTGNLNEPRGGHTVTRLQNGKVLAVGGYGSDPDNNPGALKSAELYDPVTGTWSLTGSLNSGRYDHTATLLSNGKVLVVGGVDYCVPAVFCVYPNGAELYDPATGTWSYTGSPDIAFYGHTTTLLPNGKVLMTGGYRPELYDPATGTWIITGSPHTARAGHTATLLPDGKVLIVGGTSWFASPPYSLNSAELYDPATGIWSDTGNLNTARLSPTATLLPNGKVLLAGGAINCAVFCSYLNSAELYDPTTGTWSYTGNLNTARIGPAAAPLPNGNVLVAGGFNNVSYVLSSSELYDAVTGTWSYTADLNTGRSQGVAALLSNGKVLVASGTTAELYDSGATPTPTPTPTPSPTPMPTPIATPTPTPTSTPAVGPSWSYTGNLNTARDFGHTATRLPSGKVLVAGGAGSGGSLSSAELYDPATGTWSNTGTLNAARDSHTATLLPNGKILVTGGFSCAPPPATCSQLNSAELYDPLTGTWITTGNLNTARDRHSATLLPNGKVLVAGGFLASSELNSAELYDPVTGTWSNTGNLNTGRYSHPATLLQNGKVLVVGGDNSSQGAELYDPATGTWSTTGKLNTARAFHTATLLLNGKVLVAGGFVDFNLGQVTNSAELYDPITGIWSITGSLNTGRAYHTGTLLAGGKVLVAGGFNLVNGFPNIINSAEFYDPVTGTWSNTATLNTPRHFHTASLLLNGKVLVAGPGNSAELYDPGPNQITNRKTGVFRPSTGELFLKNSNSSGFADTYIIFGNPGDYPIAGDWNGEGVDSVGIYRNGVFYLRNSNSTGFADTVVAFGDPSDQPVVGDWNGDGTDTIGVYRNGTFILRNSNTAGPPELIFTLGNPGDVAIAGDWNGDGIVSCGVFRPSNGIVYLRDSNTTGFADISFVFGNAGDKPVAGDWNADGIDTIGIYRDGLFYLSNSNATGFADIVFVLGNSGDFPIAGNWTVQP